MTPPDLIPFDVLLDLIDGFGSYPDDMQNSPVFKASVFLLNLMFTGLTAV